MQKVGEWRIGILQHNRLCKPTRPLCTYMLFAVSNSIRNTKTVRHHKRQSRQNPYRRKIFQFRPLRVPWPSVTLSAPLWACAVPYRIDRRTFPRWRPVVLALGARFRIAMLRCFFTRKFRIFLVAANALDFTGFLHALRATGSRRGTRRVLGERGGEGMRSFGGRSVRSGRLWLCLLLQRRNALLYRCWVGIKAMLGKFRSVVRHFVGSVGSGEFVMLFWKGWCLPWNFFSVYPHCCCI